MQYFPNSTVSPPHINTLTLLSYTSQNYSPPSLIKRKLFYILYVLGCITIFQANFSPKFEGMKSLIGHHGPGPDPNWDGPRRRTGFIHGFFYNLCTAICSCCYVFSCCWLLEDCFSGQRSFPWPAYGASEAPPPPPPPRIFGHQHYGPSGSDLGGPPPGPPSLYGYPGEPHPYR